MIFCIFAITYKNIYNYTFKFVHRVFQNHAAELFATYYKFLFILRIEVHGSKS